MIRFREREDCIMSAEKFMELVEENDGFELVLGYRDWEDRYMGGKGDIYWYIVRKDEKLKEFYSATYKDGKWQDVRITGKGSKRKEVSVTSGATIRRIAENAFYGQNEAWVKGKKAKVIDTGHPHKHFSKGFGEKGLDVSEAYGVTITYSDINNLSVGFHMRNVFTGSGVEIP